MNWVPSAMMVAAEADETEAASRAAASGRRDLLVMVMMGWGRWLDWIFLKEEKGDAGVAEGGGVGPGVVATGRGGSRMVASRGRRGGG